MPHGKHAKLNGLDPYYEIYGADNPRVLLHGGLASLACLSQCPIAASGDLFCSNVEIREIGRGNRSVKNDDNVSERNARLANADSKLASDEEGV